MRWLQAWRQREKRYAWHPETFVCSRRRHITPASVVAHLRPEDAGLGLDTPDGRRFARCTRCDVWIATAHPTDPITDHLPPLSDIDVPRRGEELREAIIIRAIAIDRGLHAVVFGLLGIALAVLVLDLSPLKAQAQSLVNGLSGALSDTGQGASTGLLAEILRRIGGLERRTVIVLLVTAVVYCVIEGVEAVGLWRERRWAEYLTAIATAGFLPFEVHELLARVTIIRIGALVINLAVLVWLVWRKRLFGVAGGSAALGHDRPDSAILFAPPLAD